MTNSDYDNMEDDELPSFIDNKNDIIYDDISDEEDENDNYKDMIIKMKTILSKMIYIKTILYLKK